MTNIKENKNLTMAKSIPYTFQDNAFYISLRYTDTRAEVSANNTSLFWQLFLCLEATL